MESFGNNNDSYDALRQEAELEVAETKLLRFSMGVTRMDRFRNKYSTSEGQCVF